MSDVTIHPVCSQEDTAWIMGRRRLVCLPRSHRLPVDSNPFMHSVK